MRATSPRQQAMVLGAVAALGAVLFGATVLATRTFGAEVGAPCVQGAFVCRESHGFNSNRCLHVDDTHGYCTYTCERSEDCPAGWTCGRARWSRGRDVESLCLR